MYCSDLQTAVHEYLFTMKCVFTVVEDNKCYNKCVIFRVEGEDCTKGKLLCSAVKGKKIITKCVNPAEETKTVL